MLLLCVCMYVGLDLCDWAGVFGWLTIGSNVER